MNAYFRKQELQFKQPAGTSRGTYNSRTVWFLFLEEDGMTGVGECAPLPGLSKETPEQVEQALQKICNVPEQYLANTDELYELPSVRFALETALLDLKNGGKQILFPTDFTEGKTGILINGLIWMGDEEFMLKQIQGKLKAGFSCLKMKIGAIDFEKELELLQIIREACCVESLTLRVDANGAFKPDEVLEKLNQLSQYDIHSIEQPIAAGQWKEMANICDETPIPVALDEELIGVNSRSEKEALLDAIRPQYLVLKPSLHGGIAGCDEWIELANERSIGWWITSYLESNVGLNAIAQWASTKQLKKHQGLGTGQLFTNNIESPLEIRGEQLWFNPAKSFDLPSEK